MTTNGAFVLVEGVSDQVALETLARRLGRDLRAEGVSLVTMGGATLIGEYLAELAGRQPGVRLAGLCDEAETDIFRSALAGTGLGRDLALADMEALGFYVCVEDLEDELIRALGVDAVLAVVAQQGESAGLRTFQSQPFWRGQPLAEQLRRFIGVRSGRKARYARLLVEALDPGRAPRPLMGVLGHV